ncbi:TM2 domain-containing protein [Leptolyngbya sp. FACHB-17]|uniref:TM2 domain-containing protein n=1 Tax=unclassified Leptolyngbya TaxID=2650499 RepID=UPI0016815A8A|nr:TM2 domain-containing protein [Leptolyngbya sp. FACHB-17]MBD2083292.1 TM2 domain-containing protein [Leptolyngbya sp. FACHB-17]
MNKVGVAYVLWLGGLFGLSGLHRLYNGEKKTGLLWLGTFGLFGFGQLLDLILIPKMVQVHNERLSEKYKPLLEQNPGTYPCAKGNALTVGQITLRPSKFTGVKSPKLIDSTPPISQQQATIALLKAAEARGGTLSVTQGVMATGLGFKQVETLLSEMLKSGYVEIGNDPETGTVLYEFREL